MNEKSKLILTSLGACVAITGLFVFWLHNAVESESIYWARLQQANGLLAFLSWYALLLITSLNRLGVALYAQRYLGGLGMSIFYFAGLHGALGLTKRIEGIDKIQFLPTSFQQAIGLGAIAFTFITIMMCATLLSLRFSVPARLWRWLQRCGDGAAVIVFAHVWIIGSHLATRWLQLGLFASITLLVGLKSIGWAQSRAATRLKKGLIAMVVFVIAMTALSLIPLNMQNYGQSHAHDPDAGASGGHHH